MQFTRKTGLLGLALGAIAAILWPLAARADSAASWTEIAFPIAVDEVVVAPTDPVVAYASTEAGVYRSSDGGRTWLPTGTLGQPPRGEQVVGIAVDPRSANTVYASTTQYGVYKTEDGGRTWIQLRGRGGVAPFSFSRIVVSSADPNVLFGAGDQGARVHGLFRSTDGGRSWTKVGPDFFPATEIALAPNDPRTLYVSLNSQAGLPYFDFVKSTDGGDNWTSLARSGSTSAGLSRNPVVYGIWIDPALPEEVFIATDLGVYVSSDAGASWKRAASGLPESAITSSIAYDPATGSLYVGTFEHGVFRSDDRGRSWQPAGPMLRTYARVESLAVGAIGGAPRVIALGRVGSNSFVFLLAEQSSLTNVTSRLLLPTVRH